MTASAAFWPGLLGITFLVLGAFTYRHDVQATRRAGLGLAALGPVFVAASIAAFSGEHFTAAPIIARLVPKWMPARLFIAYLVGAAHLSAASSFVARRYIRWSALGLALMFGLFVLLMDLPGAIAHPSVRIAWSLAARQTTFAVGALALFASVTRIGGPGRARMIATIARLWTAAVLVFYGIENVRYPQFTPGVPDTTPTQSWVPLSMLLAYATGILLVAFGIAMLVEKYAATAAAGCGLLMIGLTVVLYVPQWVIARGASQQITAINFVFDTLLFAGTMFIISRAISETATVTRSTHSEVVDALAS